MNDIVPELLDKIQRQFNQSFNSSTIIRSIQKKIDNGTATYLDVNNYAIEVGELLAKSLNEYISADVLPDGKMYYNIAERILYPTLGNNHELINKAISTVQTNLNQTAGFGLKGIKVPLNQDRIDGIINRISSEDKFEDIAWILNEPIVNFSQSIVDDAIHENVEFHAKSGLRPAVTRIATGHSPCKWCRDLAGRYEYPDVPEDVYKRHERCRCLVEYNPGENKRQNVWTKEWIDPLEKEKIEARKKIGL